MRNKTTVRRAIALIAATVAFADAVTKADSFDDYKSGPTVENAFSYLHQVATHPRCANCHGKVDGGVHVPTVGDDRSSHPMSISRINNVVLSEGEKGIAQVQTAQPTDCRTCHRDTNVAGVAMPPGAANDLMPGFVWHMPPPTMIVESGMTPKELCEAWLNPARNSFLANRGSRDDMETFKKEFEHHASDDPLIRWAWAPGNDRTPAPGTHQDFVQAMKTWIAGGAPCPSD